MVPSDRMLSAKELRRLARQAGADKARHLELADQCGEQEKWLDEKADEAERRALTSQHKPNTVDDVSAALSSNALRSSAQISDETREHRFVKAMERRGLTFADVATKLEEKLGRKVPRSTVQSWPKPKKDPSYRAIPQDAADALKELYGVPLNAWPRVIPA